MTGSEACVVLADTIQQLAEARGERDTYRLLAHAAIHHAAAQHGELTRLRAARGAPRRAAPLHGVGRGPEGRLSGQLDTTSPG